MQHKNVWTLSLQIMNKFVQTKLEKKSDSKECVNDNLDLNNELEMNEIKSKVITILDFSKRCSSVSQSKNGLKHAIKKIKYIL